MSTGEPTLKAKEYLAKIAQESMEVRLVSVRQSGAALAQVVNAQRMAAERVGLSGGKRGKLKGFSDKGTQTP